MTATLTRWLFTACVLTLVAVILLLALTASAEPAPAGFPVVYRFDQSWLERLLP